jgi:hypothetical protein
MLLGFLFSTIIIGQVPTLRGSGFLQKIKVSALFPIPVKIVLPYLQKA